MQKVSILLVLLLLAGCSSKPTPSVVKVSPPVYPYGTIGAADQFAAAAFPIETMTLNVVGTK